MTRHDLRAFVVQPRLMKQLSSLVATNKLPSSLLFVGAKGIGKWLVAQELAKTLTCGVSAEGFCGNCDSCRQAQRYSHPDIHYLFPLPKLDYQDYYYPYLLKKAENSFGSGSDDVSSLITIDSIRRFESKLAHKAFLSRRKVGIIYEAERMLPAAMDALLKTLEEPPAGSYLFVITDQPRFLPQTVVSRLMRLTFPPLANETVSEYLRSHFELGEEQVSVLTRFASGSLHQVEMLVEGEYLQTRTAALKLLESALEQKPLHFYANYAHGSALDSREKVERLLLHWQSFIRDLACLHSLSASGQSAELELIYRDLLGDYRRCLEKTASFHQVYSGNEGVEAARLELRRNAGPRMVAMNFLFRLAQKQELRR